MYLTRALLLSKVSRRPHWWPPPTSSRPACRWQRGPARRPTTVWWIASGRSCRRKVSRPSGREQEVNTALVVFRQLGIAAGLGGSRKNTWIKKKPNAVISSPTTSSRLQVLAAVWRNASHLRTVAEVVLRRLWRAVSNACCGDAEGFSVWGQCSCFATRTLSRQYLDLIPKKSMKNTKREKKIF